MQRIIIKEIHPATEEKKPTVIVTEDGAKMSGFLEGLKSLTPGSIIEAELEIKGKYVNIKSFTFVSKPTEQAKPVAEPKPTGEQWGEKNKTERASIEAQTAVKAILSMPLDTIPDDMMEKTLTAVNEALAWCSEKIKANMTVRPAAETKQPVKPIIKESPSATQPPPATLQDTREAVKAETGATTQKKGFTTENLLENVRQVKKFTNTKTARNYLLKIARSTVTDARIDTEPEAVWNEVKDLL